MEGKADSRADLGKKYLDKALGCLLGVPDMQDPAARATMLQIARAWMRLASYLGEQAEDRTAGAAIDTGEGGSKP